MVTNTGSELDNKASVVADLTSLFCRGGLVVENLGESGSILIRSTIQPDGDVTISIARATLDQKPKLTSHLVELETRIHKVALLVKRALWVFHGGMGVVVGGSWFAILNIGSAPEYSLTPVAVWVAVSIGSGAAIKFLFGIPFFQKFLVSLVIAGLSRFALR